MQLLVIKTNGPGVNPEYALLGKKQVQGRYTSGDWEQIRSVTRGRRVLVLIPANEVVLTSVNIPSKNKKQLLQAVPYSLEDSLAEDIENLHFAVHQDTGNDNDNDNSQVAIINRSILENTIDTLKSHGITTHFILPEILAQISHKDSWSLIYKSTNNNELTVNIRLDDFNGFVCDEDMLEMFLSEQLEKNTPRCIYTNTKEQKLPRSLQKIKIETIDPSVIDYKSAISALSLNLITNYVRQDKKPTVNWPIWRPAAILSGLLASVWISVFFWQNNLLQQQSNQLSQEIEQIYKASFPNSRIVDAAAQMKSALDKLKRSAGKTIDSPLPLISDISPLLKQYNDLTLSEIRYQENQLSLIIQSPTLTRLETFKKNAAEKMKLKVDIKSSTTTSNKVEAILIISPLANSATKELMTGIDSQENV